MIKLIAPAAVGALAALLSTTSALADFHTDWDADADGILSEEEFRQGFTARVNLADWDADADGRLSSVEFEGGVFGRYDRDASDAIEAAEVGVLEDDFGREGVWRFQGEELVEAPEEAADADAIVATEEAAVDPADDGVVLEAWDIDGDGIVLRNEFTDGFTEWGTFGEFDADDDDFISTAEFADGVFARYDDDLDGIIEEPELTDIGDDMGDGGLWDV